ncbi:MAG: methenyltetrahydrofolate cyclohydrolase [Chloroflexi bacterium RBG_13_52_12]|nr:MAG: methenyltetrahydrofolate cyclohydrolase [Chloroflexi bacterium RBG_13_52_12]
MLEKPIQMFLDELASDAPAPGGGSVAALSGAIGAALISMVSNLTVGKEKYAGVQDDINALLKKSEKLRKELTELVEEDVRVYTELSQTMKMPRDTEEQKQTRARAMDKALKAATNVPMRVAEACVSVMDICRPAAEKGNTNAVSDVGVGILMAEAGLRSAALNVLINLGWIKDENFVRESRNKLESLLKGKPALRDEIYKLVESKL